MRHFRRSFAQKETAYKEDISHSAVIISWATVLFTHIKSNKMSYGTATYKTGVLQLSDFNNYFHKIATCISD
jgi:hypothetical protein